MTPFAFFLIFAFAVMAIMGMAMIHHWAAVQSEAQAVASSMGKWGGYTDQANQLLTGFAQEMDISVSDITVQVSDIGPIPYGQGISVQLSVPFDFKLGNWNVGTFDLKGIGQSVSSYLGGYNVSYVYPI